jgi:hypothetical protein
MSHEEFGANKVGIANATSKRTKELALAGWALFRTYRFDSAADAYRVEQAVLAPYRSASLCPYLSRLEIPRGFTETIDAEGAPLTDLWARVVTIAARAGFGKH